MNPLKKLLKNNEGFTQVLVAIIVVIVAVIMIMVAAVVLSLFGTAINQVAGLSSAANVTISSVQTSGFGALQLLTVVIYVLAAVAIIGAVMGIFAYLRMRSD